MCTVVVRWAPQQPVRVLALRDELTTRPFDDPAEHWPGIVGGRDRVAGGTWCATRRETGTTALVLNRPPRRTGTPSRGGLPLAALEHAESWPEHLDTSTMASFALVLVSPDSLLLWESDGDALTRRDLPEGTHVVTSGGAEDGKATRHAATFVGDDWRTALQPPQADPTALVVRFEHGDSAWATVFGQEIRTAPGRLDLSWSRTPWDAGSWTSRTS